MKSDEPTENFPVEEDENTLSTPASASEGASSESPSAETESGTIPSSTGWRIGMPRAASESKTNIQPDVADDPEDSEDQDGFTHEGRLEEFEQDDPLAPAYDLERGTPLSASEPGEALPHLTKIRSAKEFFNTEILYRYDILSDTDRAQLRGTYRIELRGAQGGVWSMELTDSMNVVNRREEAEIVFTMQQRDFLQLVNGQLNPQLAIFAQKLRITGDLKKAVVFQSVLTPQSD